MARVLFKHYLDNLQAKINCLALDMWTAGHFSTRQTFVAGEGDSMSTFNVGDTVKSQFSDNKAVVEYGPFVNNHYGSSYLVKLLEGDKRGVSVPWEQIHMRPVPRFKVGDKVTAESYPLEDSETHTGVVKAGPFKDQIGKTRWIVRVDFGWDFYATEDRMELADAADPFEMKENTQEYSGVVYNLDEHAYIDSDGDRWLFSRIGDKVRGAYGVGVCPGDVTENAHTLEQAVDTYGPFTYEP